MKISLIQWVAIHSLRVPLLLIYFFDYIGNFPQRAFVVSTRVLLVVALFMAAFASFLGMGTESFAVSVMDNTLDGSAVSTVLGVKDKGVQPESDYPPYSTDSLELTAVSALAYDLVDSKVLFEKNKNIRVAPASTTKLMTAIVALEIYDIEEEVTIPKDCTGLEAQNAGLMVGESIIAEDLINTLLVASSGDAACALAKSKIEFTEFISRMNLKAVEFGMTSTVYDNPVGLDSYRGEHFSTANDLFLLSRNAMEIPFIAEAVGKSSYTFKSGEFIRTVYNTNSLLSSLDGTVGIKTGTTFAAKEVLSYMYKKDGKVIIIIVMGSTDRFGDTRRILDLVLKSSY